MEKRINNITDLVKEQVKYGEYRRIQILDAALGLCGETAEVIEAVLSGDKQLMINEIGDAWWYTNSLIDGLNIGSLYKSSRELDVDVDDGIEAKYDLFNIVILTSVKAGKVGDLIKKMMMKGLPVDNMELTKTISEVMVCLAIAAKRLGTSLTDIERVTIDKIYSRYPNGFNNKEVR